MVKTLCEQDPKLWSCLFYRFYLSITCLDFHMRPPKVSYLQKSKPHNWKIIQSLFKIFELHWKNSWTWYVLIMVALLSKGRCTRPEAAILSNSFWRHSSKMSRKPCMFLRKESFKMSCEDHVSNLRILKTKNFIPKRPEGTLWKGNTPSPPCPKMFS